MPVSRKVFYLLGLILFFGSCYEKKEGCLEVLASNFDLEADINCCENENDCCCEYPVLTLSIKQQYGAGNLSTTQTYLTNHDQPFQLERIKFFISDVRLTDGMNTYTVDDSLLVLARDGQSSFEPDDITLIGSNLFSVRLGTLSRPGTYTRLEFTVGLTEPERSADRDQFDSEHPLAQDELRDTINNQWLIYDVGWIPDTLTGEVTHLTLPADTSIPVSLPIDVSKDPGDNITIPIAIDYSKWFAEIDIAADDQETISQKILAGLAASFTIL